MEQPREGMGWLGNTIAVFFDAIAEQSQYAESHQLMWDRFGGLTMYACLLYGISTLFVALVLNRTAVIASTSHVNGHRRSSGGVLSFLVRNDFWNKVMLIFLRLLAVALLAFNANNLLVALSVKRDLVPAVRNSWLTRNLPDWIQYDPEVYAYHRTMGMPADEVRFGPTSTMLWPVFWAVAYSLFVETFASAITGNVPFLEGGITLFELLLALQEMSLGFFFLHEHSLAKRPSEQVLMVCLFLMADHIVGHLGAILYKNKYRLIPLTIMNFFFVWYFVSCIILPDLLPFVFPMNITVTYVGLVLVLLVLVICGAIFFLAVITKGANLRDLNYASYLYDGEDASDFFSRHLGISLKQDFYTAAVNVGMFALTLAGKSCYISTGSTVYGPLATWLEKGLWESINKLGVGNDNLQSTRVLQLLKDNKMTGYDNVIATPPERITAATPKQKRIGTLRLRIKYLHEIGVRFVQLILLLTVSLAHLVPNIFKHVRGVPCEPVEDEVESDSAFEARRARAPPFLQHLVTRGIPVDDEWEDDSPDYVPGIVVDNDSDNDSDADYGSDADFDSDAGSDTVNLLAMNELIAPDTIMELVDNDVLTHHLHDDHVMTRARYHAVYGPDDASTLLQLLLTRRKPRVIVDEDDLDPRLACVICQVKPREIITWPCKCFAICESCRLSLAAKGMEGCVCCRRDVEGVSKVFLP